MSRASRARLNRAAPLMLCSGALCVAVLGAGCLAGPDFHPPKAPATGETPYVIGELPQRTAAISTHGGDAQAFLYGEQVPRDWWRAFNSARLNRLIENALDENFNLDAARARLRQARANLRAVEGRLFPEIEAQGDITRRLSGTGSDVSGSGDFEGSGSGSGSSPFNVYTAGAVVRYGLDLFGRARRAIEAQQARARGQLHEMQAARLSVAGNIASIFIRAAELRAQIEARQKLIRAQEERIRIIDLQVDAGALARAALVSARADLAAAQAPLPSLMQGWYDAQHQLALLAGAAPSLWTPVEVALRDLRLPTELPVSLPSRLVRARPDIAVAESLVHATSAEIGVAQANLYPNITLDGSFGMVGFSASGNGVDFGRSWSIGSSILAPIFNAGRLRSERDAAIAAHQAALAEYRQTVLNAFVEVAGALRALEHGAEALEARYAALAAARESLEMAEFRFREGVVDYLEVLVTQRAYQQASLEYISALGARFQDTARLFAALGGAPEPAGTQRAP